MAIIAVLLYHGGVSWAAGGFLGVEAFFVLSGFLITSLLIGGNWHQIAVGGSYFPANGPVSPLQHTWSLAIGEQFYLLWPLLVIAVLWVARRRMESDRPSTATSAGRTT